MSTEDEARAYLDGIVRDRQARLRVREEDFGPDYPNIWHSALIQWGTTDPRDGPIIGFSTLR